MAPTAKLRSAPQVDAFHADLEARLLAFVVEQFPYALERVRLAYESARKEHPGPFSDPEHARVFASALEEALPSPPGFTDLPPIYPSPMVDASTRLAQEEGRLRRGLRGVFER